jgi:hypothetical protein
VLRVFVKATRKVRKSSDVIEGLSQGIHCLHASLDHK